MSHSKENNLPNDENINSQRIASSKKFMYFAYIVFGSILAFCFIGFPMLCIVTKEFNKVIGLYTVSLLVWGILFYLLAKFSITTNNLKSLKKNELTMLIFLLTLIMTANLGLFAGARRLWDDNTKKDFGYTFKFEKFTVITNDTNIYLGRTKNFIFTLDTKEKKSKVYPTKDLIEVDYYRLKH